MSFIVAPGPCHSSSLCRSLETTCFEHLRSDCDLSGRAARPNTLEPTVHFLQIIRATMSRQRACPQIATCDVIHLSSGACGFSFRVIYR